MIIDVPSAEDFKSSGIEFCMMAYDMTIGLYLVLEEFYGYEAEENVDTEEYWEGARGKLKNAASLLHQGIDFLLKAKICEVSPYLLIDTNIKNFPSANEDGFRSYSDFFTTESSKLPKLYNVFCGDNLPTFFKGLYESSRKRRNKIMHTIDNNLTIEAKVLVRESIKLISSLVNEPWIELREHYLTNEPEFYLHTEYRVANARLLSEFAVLMDILTESEFKKVYGVSKRSRFYYCPNCSQSIYVINHYHSAVLSPNNSSSTNLVCVLCNEAFKVKREKCEEEGCKSNVVFEDWDTCGLCWE